MTGGIFIKNEESVKNSSVDNVVDKKFMIEKESHDFECEGIKVHIEHIDTKKTLVDNLNQFFARL